MNVLPIRPIAETPDSVTLRREDFEALAELVADAQDLADADAVKAKLAAGDTEVFPFEVAERILDGGHPVTVFREHRGFSARGLAEAAGIAPSYLSEIETGKKPGSLDAMARIAAALKVPLDMLVHHSEDQPADMSGSAESHEPGGKLFPLAPGVTGDAVFGGPLDCYRYMLERRWGDGPAVLFVMMNPSCANPLMDDRTIQGVTRKVRSWGNYGRLLIANTFAYRAMEQRRLTEAEDPIGPENDAWIMRLAREAELIVFAYGKPKAKQLRARGEAVATMLTDAGFNLHALRLLKDGTPEHPLYLPDTAKPILWRTAST